MVILEVLRNVLTYIQRRDNPNNVTAAQTNAYTKAEVDQKLSTKIPNGILPIYAYGTPDNSPVGHRINGTDLEFAFKEPVLIYGTRFYLDSATISAKGFLNATSYIVVELLSGNPQYGLYGAKPKDTNTRINIGTIICNDTGIVNVSIQKARGIIAADIVGK